MKIPKIIIAVVALHVAVIVILFVQPGCQTTNTVPQNSSDDTVAEVETSIEEATPVDDGFTDVPVVQTDDENPILEDPTRPVEDDTEYTDPLEAELESQAPVAAITEPAPEFEPEQRGGSGSVHVVKPGDSLWKIAYANNTSVDAILAENGISKNKVLHPGDEIRIPGAPKESRPYKPSPDRRTKRTVATTVGGRNELYYVIPGDSLSLIARKFKTTVSEIRSANNMSNDRIYAGQELTIPTGHSVSRPSPVRETVEPKKQTGTNLIHTVGKGETLGAIARRYGVKLQDLIEFNGIENPSLVRVGQKLVVKQGAVVPVPQDSGAVEIRPSEASSEDIQDLFGDPDSIPIVPVEDEDSNP